MNTVITIFKKELIDTLRDRRTLLMMVVIPMLLFPVLMAVVLKVQISQFKKAEEKKLRVGLLAYGNAQAFRDSLLRREDLQIREDIRAESIQELIQQDSLDAVILLGEDFDRQVAELGQGKIVLYYKSTKDQNITRSRLRPLINDFEKRLLSERFDKLSLDQKIVKTVRVEEHDVASIKEKVGKAVGGFLPYIFVIFCFLGGMYPAIDMGAGEKERGTLETLLTTPASRFQILVGKFSVIVLAGIVSAAVSMTGLFVAVMQFKSLSIPQELMDVVKNILAPGTLALIFSLLFPLSIFFAACMLSLSIFARSFKEAQSLITPLNIVIIVPVFVALLPGIELNAKTALIPVLNVSLASKEIISGTIAPGILAEVYISLIVLAGASLYGCAWWFEREKTMFRET